jgi:hypothetical protein
MPVAISVTEWGNKTKFPKTSVSSVVHCQTLWCGPCSIICKSAGGCSFFETEVELGEAWTADETMISGHKRQAAPRDIFVK